MQSAMDGSPGFVLVIASKHLQGSDRCANGLLCDVPEIKFIRTSLTHQVATKYITIYCHIRLKFLSLIKTVLTDYNGRGHKIYGTW